MRSKNIVSEERTRTQDWSARGRGLGKAQSDRCLRTPCHTMKTDHHG